MKLISTILLTLFIISCNRSSDKQIKIGTPLPVIDFEKDRVNHMIRAKDVNGVIAALDNNKDLEGPHVGFTGENSESYGYYKILEETASDTTLLRLTYSSNPKMRVYGMWGLIKKNKLLAFHQLKRFRNDKSSVIYSTGCLKIPCPIYDLIERGYNDSASY